VPLHPVLILAMTRMLGGICTAGMAFGLDGPSALTWVRPVREHEALLEGDMTYADGSLARCSDVVELSLLQSRPQAPHTEDWVTDFVHRPPRLLRRSEGEKRARFLAEHLDPAPQEVLVAKQRSLCLVQPEELSASFSLDTYSGKLEARMQVSLAGTGQVLSPNGPHLPVTDMAWLDLGRSWLAGQGGKIELDGADLMEQLDAEAICITLGLSRQYRGDYWPLVVGVHAVPDYQEPADDSDA
jgi:hypothetical protein